MPLGCDLGVTPRTSLLACFSWVLSSGLSSALPLAGCSLGLPSSEKVLSCVFPADAPLGSQPPGTDLAVTSFIPFLWEVSGGFHANPSPVSSSQTGREHLHCYSTTKTGSSLLESLALQALKLQDLATGPYSAVAVTAHGLASPSSEGPFLFTAEQEHTQRQRCHRHSSGAPLQSPWDKGSQSCTGSWKPLSFWPSVCFPFRLSPPGFFSLLQGESFSCLGMDKLC